MFRAKHELQLLNKLRPVENCHGMYEAAGVVSRLALGHQLRKALP